MSADILPSHSIDLGGPKFQGERVHEETVKQIMAVGSTLHPDIVKGLQEFNATDGDARVIVELRQSAGADPIMTEVVGDALDYTK